MLENKKHYQERPNEGYCYCHCKISGIRFNFLDTLQIKAYVEASNSVTLSHYRGSQC